MVHLHRDGFCPVDLVSILARVFQFNGVISVQCLYLHVCAMSARIPVCVNLCLCDVCMIVYMWFVCVYVCIHDCMCMCVWFVYVYGSVCMHTCVHAYLCAIMCVRVYVCFVYMCMCV